MYTRRVGVIYFRIQDRKTQPADPLVKASTVFFQYLNQNVGPAPMVVHLVDPLIEPPSHRRVVNGVLPGYQGHIPRAKYQIGDSSNGNVHGKPPHHALQWSAAGMYKDVSQRSTDFPQPPKPGFFTESPPVKLEKGGVLPGYTGHLPRAKDLTGTSAHGGLAKTGTPGKQYQQGGVRSWPEPPMASAEEYKFREKVNGVIPGYKGHRQHSKDFIGASAFGGLPAASNLPMPGSTLDVSSRAQTGSPDFLSRLEKVR